MKMYTNESQTAKLIELGFEKPKAYMEDNVPFEIRLRPAYSIGELLSFLPTKIDYSGSTNELYIFVDKGGWNVEYTDFLEELCSIYRPEFIDAIFDICVKLKEEGMI